MNIEVVKQWFIGLVLVSMLSGYFLSYFWYFCICKIMKVVPEYSLFPELPKGRVGPLTGIIERIFFTVLIATNMSGVATAMVGWIVFKNTTLWREPIEPIDKNPNTRYVRIISSIGSMLIAIIGAYICMKK
jgi:hypothetical protein